jgi:orotate phosphoribosyltransferase
VERTDLAAAIFAAAHLTGRFTLRSGQTATEYFDKFQFTSRVELLDAVSDALAPLVPSEVDVLAGLQLGGVPLAAALALKTRRPVVYVRLERKTYGTAKIVEGVDVRDRVVAIVEDVVTTGGQIALSAADLRAEGAVVSHALAVVDREMGGAENLATHGIGLHALFTANDLRTARRAP